MIAYLLTCSLTYLLTYSLTRILFVGCVVVEVFDCAIIVASFALDLVQFMKGITGAEGEEALAIIIVFLLWRILRIINGPAMLFNYNLKCGPMPNVMSALPNIGGALCSTPQFG